MCLVAIDTSPGVAKKILLSITGNVTVSRKVMSVATILSFGFCHDFVPEFSDIHLGKTLMFHKIY